MNKVSIKIRMKAISILFIIGLPLYFICSTHFCMCGHLKHDPYSIGDIINDVLLIAFWTTSAAISFSIKTKRKIWFIVPSLLALIMRYPLKSIGGVDMVYLTPLLLISLFYAVRFLWKPEIYLTKEERKESLITISHK